MSAKHAETIVESGTEIFIPLNKLKKSPKNARKTPHSEAAIEAYAASIAAKGILQNLVVEPEFDTEGAATGSYFVTIGEGRRLAQLLRVKRKEIKKIEPIRCIVDTANDPHEISLDENVTRENMHPADQFEAFKKLAEERGFGAEEIAARFGVTPHVVRQRLRLGAVAPSGLAASAEDRAVAGRLTTLLTMMGAAALLLSTVGAKPTPRCIWNASESVPIGFYRLRTAGQLAVTDLVAILPPEPLATFLADGNYLPRNVPLLKRVLALPGQTVCRDHLAITVGNVWVGEARGHDSRGRPLPIWQACRVVADGEVFVMNWQSADSLDGRYFGVLPASAVIGKAEPLWTGEEE